MLKRIKTYDDFEQLTVTENYAFSSLWWSEPQLYKTLTVLFKIYKCHLNSLNNNQTNISNAGLLFLEDSGLSP